jgi:hypothetical protein
VRWQDGIPDVTSEALDVESGGARAHHPLRMESEELVTELPLELAVAGGRWPRRARRERGPEGLNQRGLAAAGPIGHVMQRRLDSKQCTAGGFKGITYALVELRPNDAARASRRRTCVSTLRRRRRTGIPWRSDTS